MKICQIVPCFPYQEHLSGKAVERGYHIGGVEKHAYMLSQHLSELGDDITVITTKSPEHNQLSEIKSNVKIVRIPLGISLYSSSFPIRTLIYLKPNKYDVIHAHTPTPSIADMAAIRNYFHKCPFVLTYHNDIGKKGFLGNIISSVYNSTLGSLLLSHSDAIIATSKSYAANSSILTKYKSKVKVIPNAVDIEIFHPGIDGQSIRTKFGIPTEAKVVLFVGRLDSYKGCDYLINAFVSVHNILPQIHLIFVGTGPLLVSLQKRAIELGIQAKVSFTGYVSDQDLPKYYSTCDLFVLPSVSSLEGFGIVQLEALACGKPVITTTIPGPSEVDIDNVGTIHVPPKDIGALSEAIIKILSDARLADNMGRNGFILVSNKYSWLKVSREINILYRDLVSLDKEK